jgi:threonine dehydratase
VSQAYLKRILKAQVHDVAIESPLERAPRLSRRLGAEVLLKREDLQPVFSFKIRGAANRIAQIPADQAHRGVICASAGNHAQGVALAARRRGLRAVIVMPVTTPTIKVEAVRDLGGEVVLHGDDYDAACDRARELAIRDGMVFVHPFDDPEVIAGQGTIAIELLRQRPAGFDVVFIPIGGGGLIAGIGTCLKALSPEVRIIGVEPEDAPTMHAALAAGQPVTLPRVGLFADGVAVRRVGDETFRLAKECVDEIVLVSNDEICAAVQDIFEDTRSIAEPAGALAVAGLKRWAATNPVAGMTVVTLVSGANMNFDRLRHVAERADLGAEREALLAVEIPERPGSFLAFCNVVGNHFVTEFNYRYGDPARARVFVGLALSGGRPEKNRVVEAIRAAGLPVVDMSGDEMALLHVRYMVGGRVAGLENERLFRFEFPERPGALLGFLTSVGAAWNISLFHYRNHGADHGRVLVGIQVPPADDAAFLAHLEALNFAWAEETDNPAYRLFLAP